MLQVTWRSCTWENGAPSAMMNGTQEKAKWCADNWATTARLGSLTVRTSDKRPVMIIQYNKDRLKSIKFFGGTQ